jgi:hypothetical protein
MVSAGGKCCDANGTYSNVFMHGKRRPRGGALLLLKIKAVVPGIRPGNYRLARLLPTMDSHGVNLMTVWNRMRKYGLHLEKKIAEQRA